MKEHNDKGRLLVAEAILESNKGSSQLQDTALECVLKYRDKPLIFKKGRVMAKTLKEQIIKILYDELYISWVEEDPVIEGRYDVADEIIKLFESNK